MLRGSTRLCVDHYPLFSNDNPKSNTTKDGYKRNLEVLRELSIEHQLPFWNFFNAMPFGGHVNPTEAQLRWQAFTSVAYGARGVLYFMYWAARDSHLSLKSAFHYS